MLEVEICLPKHPRVPEFVGERFRVVLSRLVVGPEAARDMRLHAFGHLEVGPAEGEERDQIEAESVVVNVLSRVPEREHNRPLGPGTSGHGRQSRRVDPRTLGGASAEQRERSEDA